MNPNDPRSGIAVASMPFGVMMMIVSVMMAFVHHFRRKIMLIKIIVVVDGRGRRSRLSGSRD
jgi:hypothetical protein